MTKTRSELFARRTVRKPIVKAAGKGVRDVFVLTPFIRQTVATAFFTVRPKPLFASLRPFFGPRAGPVVRINSHSRAKQKDQYPPIRGILRIAGRFVFGISEILIFRLGKNENRIEFTATLEVALALRISTVCQEI